MAQVTGSCQNPRAMKSITVCLGDLYVTGFMINQCMRPLKKPRELIRDSWRRTPPTPVVLLDLLLTSCSLICNDTHSSHYRKFLQTKCFFPSRLRRKFTALSSEGSLLYFWRLMRSSPLWFVPGYFGLSVFIRSGAELLVWSSHNGALCSSQRSP